MENSQLVILHGWFSSKEKWEKVKQVLEKEKIKVLIPDLPGFKEETKINRPWSLDTYIKWVKDLIEEKISSGEIKEPFFLLGHSFGGRVSINFAIRYPNKIKGLILVSSAGIRNKKNPKILFLRKMSFFPGYSFFKKIYYRFILKKTDYINAEPIMRKTLSRVVEEDLSYVLSRIRVKTLIIWGEKDNTTPLTQAYLMKEKIKDSRLEILENIGHTPYLEDPEFLAKKILEFIQS